MKLHEVAKGLTMTHSGKLLNIMRPDKGDIEIEDIAHALSHMPRFGGHTNTFYSVAQHSLLVSRMCGEDNPELALAGLMHDASEAYLMDLPSPVKAMMPSYRAYEVKLLRVIFMKYNIPYPIHEVVKLKDMIALEWEWDHLMVEKTPPKEILDSENAKRIFLEEFEMLMERVEKLRIVRHDFNAQRPYKEIKR